MGIEVELYRFPREIADALPKLSLVAEHELTVGGPDSLAAARIRRSAVDLGVAKQVVDLWDDDQCFHNWHHLGEPIAIERTGTRSQLLIGRWENGFAATRSRLLEILGKTIYDYFPTAESEATWIKPDWPRAFRTITESEERLASMVNASEDSQGELSLLLDDVRVILDTAKYVLQSPDPKEFLFYWSA